MTYLPPFPNCRKTSSPAKGNNGIILPFQLDTGKFIILSDQHKGGRDFADDFAPAEANYLTALKYYYNNEFTLIGLGDCEELWENTPKVVIEKNRAALLEEARFLQKGPLLPRLWQSRPRMEYTIQQNLYLKPIFGDKLKVYEGMLLQTKHNEKTYSIFLAHGHQGDKKSDGNPLANGWSPLSGHPFNVSLKYLLILPQILLTW
jgi:hypothetical protein